MVKSNRKVLVATDFSPGSREALRSLEKFWPRGTSVRIHLVHVLEPLPLVEPLGPTWCEVKQAWEQRAELMLERNAALLRQHLGSKAHVDAHLARGVPHVEICREAVKLRADLIVIGTHGRTGLAHIVMGSVAERVMQHARCSVLAVPSRR